MLLLSYFILTYVNYISSVKTLIHLLFAFRYFFNQILIAFNKLTITAEYNLYLNLNTFWSKTGVWIHYIWILVFGCTIFDLLINWNNVVTWRRRKQQWLLHNVFFDHSKAVVPFWTRYPHLPFIKKQN